MTKISKVDCRKAAKNFFFLIPNESEMTGEEFSRAIKTTYAHPAAFKLSKAVLIHCEAIKREGNKLKIKYKKPVPEFKQWLEKAAA